jgi:putative ABC transport system permease protein
MGLGLREAARLSVRNLRRRSAVVLLLALMIPSASLAVPLTMGASFEESLRQDIYDSLGAVDEMVRSQGVMRPAIFDALANDTRLAAITDGLAPALAIAGVLTGPSGDRRDTQLDIIGIDGRSWAFGSLSDQSGRALGNDIAPGEAYLREDCARRIGAGEGDTVHALFKDPSFSLESIYSPGTPAHPAELRVRSVFEKESLGALKLVPRGPDRRTAFVNLSWLMDRTGQKGINAILVSNNGDSRSGAAGTSEVAARLEKLLKGVVGFGEGGFILTATKDYVKLENQKIFFSGGYAGRVRATDARVSAVSSVTSYFVNELIGNGSHIAYSTVTAFDPADDSAFGSFINNSTGLPVTGDIADDEIIVTGYTAGRLGVTVGDNVTLNYTVYDASFRQQLRYETFRVRYVVDLTGKADDPELMPPFPGIKGKASCGDWSPPIPINYSVMVQEDLNYWVKNGGTPKAYISLSEGRKLWGNDLGNTTTVKALPAPGVSASELARAVGDGLNATLGSGEMGVTVEKVKRDAIDSVSGLEIVTEALLAFGTAVTGSGMVLIYVVVISNIEGRRREIGILRSLGFKRRNITSIITMEGAFLSLAGSLAGVGAGALFAALGVWASNNLWTGILPVSSKLHLPGTDVLAAGFLAGFVVSVAAFAAGSRSASRGAVSSGIRGFPDAPAPARAPAFGTLLLASYVAFLIALAGAGYYLSAASGDLLLLYYFAFGDLLLLATGLLIYMNLERIGAALSGRARLGRIPLANFSRNRKRTGAYIVVYALVVFPLLTLSAYLPMQAGSVSAQANLRGGGYDILGTSEVPMFFDLGNASERSSHNVTGFPDVSVVQFLSFGNPGGTCSNLDTKAPPKILAANGSFVSDSKIPVSDSVDGSRGAPAWRLLDRDEGKGVVPAIGDYTTVVWIFGKGLGGTIPITDEHGNAVRLRIVAILHDSVFQGSVFISEGSMKRLYPTLSQYNMFLFRLHRGWTGEGAGTNGASGAGAGAPENGSAANVAAALESSLSGYGFSARPVSDLVRDLIRVDLAYVSMLQAMLAAGLLIGTLGFAAKVARETIERRFELGVLRAVGFRRGQIARLLVQENVFIFLLGFGLALASALPASYLFLHDLPPPLDTLAVLVLLLGVITGSALAPARRFNDSSPASVLRAPE